MIRTGYYSCFIVYFAFSKPVNMKKISLLLIAAFTISGIYSIESCEPSKASASKMLKFNLEKGKGYDYEMVWDFDQEIMKQELKMSMMAGYSMEVTDDDGNTKTINAQYKDFKLNMKVMGMEIDVDTDKPAPEGSMEDLKGNISGLMSKIFSTIKGKKFGMKVDKEGTVLEVTGFDQITSAMVDSLGLDEDSKEKIMQSAKQQFNDKDIKDQFAQIFYIFPQKEVKVGDSWGKNYETVGKLPAKYNTTYKVKEIEGDMVTLSAKTDIQSSTEQMKMEGKQTGTLIVDSRSGLVVNADFEQEIDISTNGMSMALKGKGKIKGTAR